MSLYIWRCTQLSFNCLCLFTLWSDLSKLPSHPWFLLKGSPSQVCIIIFFSRDHPIRFTSTVCSSYKGEVARRRRTLRREKEWLLKSPSRTAFPVPVFACLGVQDIQPCNPTPFFPFSFAGLTGFLFAYSDNP